jgi:hypothetical protein
MHMPATRRQWTAAAVRGLPDDGNRYELIDGELLVTPAPRWSHQEAVGELYYRLRRYLDREGIGHVMMSPADLELEPETIVQPDVFVVPVTLESHPREWTDVSALLLASCFRNTRGSRWRHRPEPPSPRPISPRSAPVWPFLALSGRSVVFRRRFPAPGPHRAGSR